MTGNVYLPEHVQYTCTSTRGKTFCLKVITCRCGDAVKSAETRQAQNAQEDHTTMEQCQKEGQEDCSTSAKIYSADVG